MDSEESKMEDIAIFIAELFELNMDNTPTIRETITNLADIFRRRRKFAGTTFTDLKKRHAKFCNAIDFIISNLGDIDASIYDGELNHFRICTEMAMRVAHGGKRTGEKSKLIRDLISLKEATHIYMESIKQSGTYSRIGRPTNVHKNIGDDYDYSYEFRLLEGILADVVGFGKIVSLKKCQELLYRLVELDIDGFKFSGFSDASLEALVKGHRKRRKALEKS